MKGLKLTYNDIVSRIVGHAVKRFEGVTKRDGHFSRDVRCAADSSDVVGHCHRLIICFTLLLHFLSFTEII